MFALKLYEFDADSEAKNLEERMNSQNIPGFRSFYEICAMNAKFTPDFSFF
jgi:hypothetical protein